MTATVALPATAREKVGKGAARTARRQGMTPAVIYGDKKAPEPIQIEERLIKKLLNTGHFLTTTFEIEVGGKKTRCLPRDVQLDPVRETPVHVDFLRISKDTRVDVAVPVSFVNEDDCPGLREGGVLNIVRHEVELSCPADSIPDAITADLTGLAIGDSIHISAIKLPANVEPTITDRDFTVATIAAPTVAPTEEESEETPETEVIEQNAETVEGVEPGDEEANEG
ncbi:50S ribosomal protein L25/general stress protein Ctc [Lutibaculum baratangense]|uniref:Large ribosomal subunit protein bL25 n=1 Tax=Lutibaculum baratangense AMV1 TaxID=631454 RepID=V4RCQ4_9HYPH|nr:50S ribosomal protein L25/general stress protein Ctc [Lutibaculum baratangense]ESR23179.1 LSU ribosomal protein L25p [Lutibaculum baratangense AMV1]